MRRYWISLALCLFAALPFLAEAQDTKSPSEKTALVAPNFLGPILGYYSANVEFKLNDKLSLDIEPGYFNLAALPLLGSFVSSSGLEFWYGSCRLGVDYYPKEIFKGGFVGAYAKGSYFKMGTGIAAIRTGSGGVGAKAGYRWTGSWASFAIGAGYEYNMAFINLSSAEDPAASLFTNAVDGGSFAPFVLFSFVL
jgi:hypothetical protein